MWLADRRDWLSDEINLARAKLGPDTLDRAEEAATVPLRLADLALIEEGLTRALSLLDGLTIDPSQIRSGGRPRQAARAGDLWRHAVSDVLRRAPVRPAAREPIGPALQALAERVGRLGPNHRDPERFHVEKDEIRAELRRLAQRVG